MKNMDYDINNFENFILDNRDNFTNDDPPNGHVDRFESKLSKHNAIFKRNKTLFVLKIAASISIIITLSVTVLWVYLNYSYQPKNPIASIETIEFNETINYYSDQVSIRIDQLKKMKSIETDQKNNIFAELDTMAYTYGQLENELKNNPSDERVMNAIIEHYQIKLDALNQIIQSFSISHSNLKNERHENTL